MCIKYVRRIEINYPKSNTYYYNYYESLISNFHLIFLFRYTKKKTDKYYISITGNIYVRTYIIYYIHQLSNHSDGNTAVPT